MGGDLTDTVTKAQNKVNDVARKAAVSEWIKIAEASEYADHAALVASVSMARAILEKSSATDEELSDAAYNIAMFLRAQSSPAETESGADISTEPADTEPSESDPTDTTISEAPTEAPSASDTDVPEKGCRGCGSAVGMGAAAVAVVSAAIALKKEKED